MLNDGQRYDKSESLNAESQALVGFRSCLELRNLGSGFDLRGLDIRISDLAYTHLGVACYSLTLKLF